jgi:hypothetical protein
MLTLKHGEGFPITKKVCGASGIFFPVVIPYLLSGAAREEKHTKTDTHPFYF